MEPVSHCGRFGENKNIQLDAEKRHKEWE